MTKILPLPSLDETLTLFLSRLKPLTDAKSYAQSEITTGDFYHLDALKLQRLLEQRAVLTEPESWLVDYQRAEYWEREESLPLSTNQTLKISWQAPQQGLKRVAHFVHALARVHRGYLRGELFTANDPLCREQMKVLLGAARRPVVKGEKYFFANLEQEKKRHIVLLYHGHAWALDLIDEHGGIASPAQLEDIFYHLVKETPEMSALPFTTPSLADRKKRQEIRAQLICRSENAEIWQILEKALFIISLDKTPIRNAEEALNHVAFGDGSLFWAYKPLNYCCNFSDDRYFLHSENSWIDPTSLADILAAAQQFQEDKHFSRRNTLAENLGLRPLIWQIDKHEHKDQNGGTQKLIKDVLIAYEQQSDRYMITLIDLFLTPIEQNVLRKYDPNAVVQILLQYAQLKTWKEIKSSRETIDMRAFQGGRQSFMQTVTDSSVTLVKAMQEFKEHSDIKTLMQNYIAEHAERRMRCQAGRGIYDHLLGLESIAREQKVEPTFFKQNAFKIFRRHHLATQSLYNAKLVSYLAFMPDIPDGIAINYTLNRNHCNIILTHRKNKAQEIATFHKALKAALKQILRILD